MSFQGREYINYAEHLSIDLKSLGKAGNLHLSQAASRAIASRAYYGALLEVRDYFSLQNSEASSIHQEVGKRIKIANREAANDLSILKALRVKADYKSHKTVSGRDVSNSLRLARKILTYIDSQIS